VEGGKQVLMRYVDTSVVVAALVPEIQTQVALGWIAKQSDALSISPWVTTEVSSALSRKVRTGRLLEADRNKALREYENLILPAMSMVSISRDDYLVAARIANDHGVGIRAPDALHLAVAVQRGLTLCTFDKHLVEGAKSLGYAVELIG
jgi:uncharacterized protein